MLEQFSFGENDQASYPSYIAIELPHHARSNATKLRWWQPSFNGTFLEEWALDQVSNMLQNSLFLEYLQRIIRC